MQATNGRAAQILFSPSGVKGVGPDEFSEAGTG